jgi:hypothetical protein
MTAKAPLARVNHLRDLFYSAPGPEVTQTMSLRQWQETALYTEGWILACGRMFDLKAKRIAPGIYRISAAPRS